MAPRRPRLARPLQPFVPNHPSREHLLRRSYNKLRAIYYIYIYIHPRATAPPPRWADTQRGYFHWWQWALFVCKRPPGRGGMTAGGQQDGFNCRPSRSILKVAFLSFLMPRRPAAERPFERADGSFYDMASDVLDAAGVQLFRTQVTPFRSNVAADKDAQTAAG